MNRGGKKFSIKTRKLPPPSNINQSSNSTIPATQKSYRYLIYTITQWLVAGMNDTATVASCWIKRRRRGKKSPSSASRENNESDKEAAGKVASTLIMVREREEHCSSALPCIDCNEAELGWLSDWLALARNRASNKSSTRLLSSHLNTPLRHQTA